MQRTQKILTVTLWGALVLAMIAIMAVGVRGRFARSTVPDVLYPAPDFTLTDQNDHAFSSKTLRGHVWICDFVFTQCADICPRMTQEMEDLQKQISDPAVHLVSVSVDPTRDTPAVLKQYAKLHGADESRWTFLTSTNPQDIYDVANGFKVNATQRVSASNPPIHGGQFFLIDDRQKVRGIYHYTQPESMKKLVQDAQALAADASKDHAP